MKKYIFTLLSVLALGVSGSAFALDSFANFFSISSQPLASGAAATFDLQNSRKNINISADRKTITLTRTGQYYITFTATGQQTPGGVESVGPWSVGLTRNGGLIVGSVAAAHEGTDAEDNLMVLTTTGAVTINGTAGDTFQVINTTSTSITLEGTVSGGVVQNTSIGINFIQVE